MKEKTPLTKDGLILFDLDGTLTPPGTPDLWLQFTYHIATFFADMSPEEATACAAAHQKIFIRFAQKKISKRAAEAELIALWRNLTGCPLTRSNVEAILHTIADGASLQVGIQTVKTITELLPNLSFGILTIAFADIAKQIAIRAGIPTQNIMAASSLTFNGQQELTGFKLHGQAWQLRKNKWEKLKKELLARMVGQNQLQDTPILIIDDSVGHFTAQHLNIDLICLHQSPLALRACAIAIIHSISELPAILLNDPQIRITQPNCLYSAVDNVAGSHEGY